jgi:hypothetical protein
VAASFLQYALHFLLYLDDLQKVLIQVTAQVTHISFDGHIKILGQLDNREPQIRQAPCINKTKTQHFSSLDISLPFIQPQQVSFSQLSVSII